MSKPQLSDNPFSKLQEEQEEQFKEVTGAVKSNIQGRRGFWTLVGDILDLYVPKVVGTLLGGKDKSTKEIESSNTDSESKNI